MRRLARAVFDSLTDPLSVLKPSPAERERLGLAPGSLELDHCWPRSSEHMLLDYVSDDGARIAGQWFNDRRRLERVARATAQSAVTCRTAVVVYPELGVLLQAGGADRRLPGLAELVATPGAKLLVHRPEKRAVVLLERPGGRCYAKVVRPKRANRLARKFLAVRQLTSDAFTVPELLEIDVAAGVTIWSALPGVTLRELLFGSDGRGTARGMTEVHSRTQQRRGASSPPGERYLQAAAQGVGRALRTLHGAVPPPNTTSHGVVDEISWLENRLERIEQFTPRMYGPCRAAATGVFENLVADRSPLVLVHRDFSDSQVLIDARGRVGLLDFDTLALGEAALDLARLLVCLQWRAAPRRCLMELAQMVAAGFLEGYGADPAVYRRLNAYTDAAYLRWACREALLSRKASVTRAWLARIGQPVFGMTEGERPGRRIVCHSPQLLPSEKTAGSPLTSIQSLELSAPDVERLGLTPGPLELSRCLPRSREHMLVRYVAGDGARIAGQWFNDPERLRRVAQATARAGQTPGAAVVTIPMQGVLLQAGGADRRLPGLAPLLAQPGTRLLVHRPERRATVRLESPSGLRYAKVVRPQRVQGLVSATTALLQLGAGAFAVPELLDVDAPAGVSVWAALAGSSLNRLLRASETPEAGGRARDGAGSDLDRMDRSRH